MRHATANRPSGARRPLAAAIAVAVITAAPVAAVGVNDAISALQQNGQYAADASHDDVMSAYTSIDKPGRLFLTNSGSSTSKRVPKGVVALPWKISASFTLNGPDVSVSDVSGASGMIGIRIALHATKPDVTANLTPIVAFTIPGRVGSDVTADDGVLVSSDNTSTLVAAVGKPGEDLTFNAYVTAKHFTMSSLSIAAVEGNVQQSLPDLTKRATTLVDGLTNVGSQRNRKLIAQLEQLRDNEKALAKQTIAVRSKAHDQAFDGYIDAYVGSYTTQIRGRPGQRRQRRERRIPAYRRGRRRRRGDSHHRTARHIRLGERAHQARRRGTTARLQRLQCRPIAAVRGHDPVFDGFHRRIHGSA